jgi:cytochrome c-type biogenesis protein CcmH/NrfG
MAIASTSDTVPVESSVPKQVGMVAAFCLALGLVIGFTARGMQGRQGVANAAAIATHPSLSTGGHAPGLQDMKRMADKQAAPLLAQLESKPNDTALLTQLGALYHSTHQFKDAAGYFSSAVQADPNNVALRNRLALSLYRSGDVDGSMAQLREALRRDPKDANSLFNLGMIRLQGKSDGKGAVAAWQRLLKSNPQLSADRKAQVQKLMADVLTTLGVRQVAKGALHE